MGPIKTSQFAELWLAAEGLDDTAVFEPSSNDLATTNTAPNTMQMVKAGFVSSVRVQETLNSQQRNVIGTPVPIFMPGYYQATITAQKATIDLTSWKTMLNLNPLTAFRPDTYLNDGSVNSVKILDSVKTMTAGKTSDFPDIPRFTFLLVFKDLISSAKEEGVGDASMPTGVFVCMLREYSTTIASSDSLIMEDITMVARPIVGSWFSAIQGVYHTNPSFGFDPAYSIPYKGDKTTPVKKTAEPTTRGV